jgi:hypothetical protein
MSTLDKDERIVITRIFIWPVEKLTKYQLQTVGRTGISIACDHVRVCPYDAGLVNGTIDHPTDLMPELAIAPTNLNGSRKVM